MELINKSHLQTSDMAARHLLGCEIWRTLPSGEVLKARIVETESYNQDDPASHTFKGESPRNRAMFGESGHAYIYFTYGMHWCLNVTAGPKGYGAGALIRGAEPLEGIATMQSNRKLQMVIQLTNGPAKLTQALAIDKSLYEHDLTQPPLQIFEPRKREFGIIQTTRIGISQAVHKIARFYIKDNPFVSKK